MTTSTYSWRHVLPRILPSSWLVLQEGADGCAYEGFVLRVIASVGKELDGKNWLHVSVSHPKRLPTWEELREVKDLFIGKDRKAIQVLPPEAEYVNIHPNCLHLWCCLDGDSVPDFTRGTKSI